MSDDATYRARLVDVAHVARHYFPRVHIGDPQIDVRLTTEFSSTGYQRSQYIQVRAGSDVGDAIQTVVHELAHVYCFNRYSHDVEHGPKWRAAYIGASGMLGVNVKDLVIGSGTYALDRAMRDRYRSAVRAGVFGIELMRIDVEHRARDGAE